jgi:hypothetical protein
MKWRSSMKKIKKIKNLYLVENDEGSFDQQGIYQTLLEKAKKPEKIDNDDREEMDVNASNAIRFNSLDDSMKYFTM